MSCGYGNLTKHNSIDVHALNSTVSTEYKSVWLYTAYVGRVSVKVGLTSDPNQVNMECRGVGTASDIIVREIDVVKSNIDVNSNPSLRQLSSKRPAVVNIKKNKENFFLIQQLELQKARLSGDNNGVTLRQTSLDKFSIIEHTLSNRLTRKHSSVQFNAESLRQLYAENSVVDIHFNTTLYLQFLQEKLNRPSINNGKLLVSLYNVADMDNAYFTGEYMVYGNGKDYFYPLTAIDTCGHELGHGVIQSTASLEYQAESGALNESYADVLGSAFEFWLYDKFNNDDDPDNDLQGGSDWLIGEDIGKQLKYLRNLKDPTNSQNPQPKKYKGQHWVNTRDTSDRNDYGGVHTNSGVGNHCFYLLSQLVSIDTALPIFYNCLLKLNRRSPYSEFRDTLYNCTPDQFKTSTAKCLAKVNLPISHVPDTPEPDTPEPDTPEPDTPEPDTPNESDHELPTVKLPYPNDHIPYIRGICCPHCLCLQRQTPRVNREYIQVDDSSSESEPTNRRKRKRSRNNTTYKA
jgi:hypothetical protein